MNNTTDQIATALVTASNRYTAHAVLDLHVEDDAHDALAVAAAMRWATTDAYTWRRPLITSASKETGHGELAVAEAHSDGFASVVWVRVPAGALYAVCPICGHEEDDDLNAFAGHLGDCLKARMVASTS